MKGLSELSLASVRAAGAIRGTWAWINLIKVLINSWKSSFCGGITRADIGLEVKTCRVKACKVNTCRVKTCKVRAYWVRTCRVKACRIRTYRLKSCRIRVCRVKACGVSSRSENAKRLMTVLSWCMGGEVTGIKMEQSSEGR